MKTCTFALLSLLLMACDPAAVVGSPKDLAGLDRVAAAPGLVTDSERYVFRPGDFGPELTITSRFQAPDDTSVDLANCNGASSWRLQKLEANGWVEAWLPAVDACRSVPVAISRNGSRPGSHLVRRGAGSALQPGTDGRELADGTYRLVWEGLTTASGIDVDASQRTSNQFVIGH